jgi:RimJ/RimL family protein N-acetyltransferase
VLRRASYPPPIEGHGLVLCRWDAVLARQMDRWEHHGFPFHAFDLTDLRDPNRAAALIGRMREDTSHRHFVACEDGIAVGRASVNLYDAAGLYLWAVHVPPEHEGRGVCRRMLATLMTWLETAYPTRDFVLTTNTFAVRAHAAYEALGFRVAESTWHFDRELAAALWRAPASRREEIARHTRFMNGRWEVRVQVMRRRRGAPMQVPAASPEVAISA